MNNEPLKISICLEKKMEEEKNDLNLEIGGESKNDNNGIKAMRDVGSTFTIDGMKMEKWNNGENFRDFEETNGGTDVARTILMGNQYS